MTLPTGSWLRKNTSPLPTSAQAAEKRIALVVGNANYQAGALPTPANDAGLIAQTLQAAGFDVVGVGQSTAGLPTSKWEGLEVDETLLNALLGEWPRRFSKSPASWRSRALFRSLNMAHAAAQIPPLVDLTAQSLGRHVALWVSAFEILTHPEEGDAGLKEVYRVLENVDWRMEDCKELVHDCYLGRSGKTRRGTLACWIYGEMNHARNDYLHGNELSEDRLIIKASGRNLFQFAPSLYRLLLTGYLGIDFYGPRRPADATTEVQRILNFRFENRQGDHERAISRILKPPSKRD